MYKNFSRNRKHIDQSLSSDVLKRNVAIVIDLFAYDLTIL